VAKWARVNGPARGPSQLVKEGGKKVHFAFFNYHKSQFFLPSTLKPKIVPPSSLKTGHLTHGSFHGGFSFFSFMFILAKSLKKS